MDTPITRAEHEEFRKRIEEAIKRQDARIQALEDTVVQINEIASNTKLLASNMASMLKEQELQGERLAKLENRDGEKWRQVAGYVATAVIGLILGFIFTQIGM